ncbi:hypothetical protein KY285_009081 [Solanum tuberosum]|nr:hypothetical protein KY284_007669 [Solanum tuberosum]KAH0747424.1 hypothetical protein KY285_009081 [Solanum tuberosum]
MKPQEGWVTRNTDGAIKGNLGKSAYGYCIRDKDEDLIYVEAHNIGEATNMEAEVAAMWKALQFCFLNDLRQELLLSYDSHQTVIQGPSKVESYGAISDSKACIQRAIGTKKHGSQLIQSYSASTGKHKVVDSKRKKEMRKNLSNYNAEMQGSQSISSLASTYTGEYTCRKKKESGRTKKVADEIGKRKHKEHLLVAEIYNIHGKEVMKDVDYLKMNSPELGVEEHHRKHTQVVASGKERKKMEM